MCVGACIAAALLTACGTPSTSSEYLARARQSIELGDYRSATIDLKNVLQKEPENVEARALLGRTALDTGDIAGAVRELRLARQLGATDARVEVDLARALLAQRDYNAVLQEFDANELTDPAHQARMLDLQGRALLALGRGAEARTRFESALGRDPNAIRPRLGLAESVLVTEGPSAARRMLEETRTRAPRDALVLLALGELSAKEKDYATAEQLFSEAVKVTSDRASVFEKVPPLARLAEMQIALSKPEAAEKTVAQLAKLAPSSAEVLNLQAWLEFLRGNYDAARIQLEQVLAFDQRNRAALLLLGATNYAQGNLDQADMYLSAVLSADPGNTFGRQLLANTRLRQKKPKEALAAIEPAARAGDPMSLAVAGWAAVSAGESDAGISYLEQAAREQPNDANAQLRLATAYIAAGRAADAIATLEALPASDEASIRRDLLLVNARVRSEDVAGALKIAQKLADSRPDDLAVLSLLASLHTREGDTDRARKILLRARELDRANPGPLMQLGGLEFMLGSFSEAEAYFRQALALRPTHPSIFIALARTDMAVGKTDEAMRWLEAARLKNPSSAAVNIQLGYAYLAQREVAKAEQAAREAVRLAPTDSAALGLLGFVLAGSGRVADGIGAFEDAVEQQPQSAGHRLNLARTYLRAGRAEEALATVREALRVNPSDVPTLVLLGSLVGPSDPEEARSVITRIRTIAPDAAEASIIEGDLELRARHYAQAVKAYQAAARQQPTREAALREHAARHRGGLPDEIEPLRRWLSDHPNDWRVLLALGWAEQARGDLKAAITAYQAVLRVNPSEPVALNNLAYLYLETGDPAAVKIAEKAYDVAPGMPSVMDTYAWSLVQTGDTLKAERLLREAASKAPDSGEIHYHLAVAMVRNGKSDEGREVLRRLLADGAKFPAREDAQELLASLQP